MLALEKVDREQLNKLDKETLIELLLSALARIDELERVVASQAATIQQLQDQLSKNSSNSIGYKLSHFVSCQARNLLQFTHDKSNQKIQKHSPAYTGHSGR